MFCFSACSSFGLQNINMSTSNVWWDQIIIIQPDKKSYLLCKQVSWKPQARFILPAKPLCHTNVDITNWHKYFRIWSSWVVLNSLANIAAKTELWCQIHINIHIRRGFEPGFTVSKPSSVSKVKESEGLGPVGLNEKYPWNYINVIMQSLVKMYNFGKFHKNKSRTLENQRGPLPPLSCKSERAQSRFCVTCFREESI